MTSATFGTVKQIEAGVLDVGYVETGPLKGASSFCSMDEEKEIRVHRVWAAIDCGVLVNPLGVEAQIQSAIVYGQRDLAQSA